MDYHKLAHYIEHMAEAHQEYPKPGAKTHRQLGLSQTNPYFTHPLWAAMMILSEKGLSEKLRWNGCLALLFHDQLEDTIKALPADLPQEVVQLVKKLTVPKLEKYKFSGFEYEREHVLDQSAEVQLLKLYDKVATLYDGALPPERYQTWCELTESLINNVEKKYGSLRICMLGSELIKTYR